MKLKEVEEFRPSKVLLKEIFRDGTYQEIRLKFRELLSKIKEIADTESEIMEAKRRKLLQFETSVIIFETDNLDIINPRIDEWSKQEQRPETRHRFLIYKTPTNWFITGRDIAKGEITKTLEDLNVFDSLWNEKLKDYLTNDPKSSVLPQDSPLHLLAVDCFGYYRPSIFISYSWPDLKYSKRQPLDTYNKMAVHEIADDLKCAGFRVIIDKDDLAPGMDLHDFINLITDAQVDYIGLMATPLYKTKYLNPTHRGERENNKTYIEARRIVSKAERINIFYNKVYTLLLEGNEQESIPDGLNDKIYCKFTENDYFETLLRLIQTAYNIAQTNQRYSDLIKDFDNKRPTVKLPMSHGNPNNQPDQQDTHSRQAAASSYGALRKSESAADESCISHKTSSPTIQLREPPGARMPGAFICIEEPQRVPIRSSPIDTNRLDAYQPTFSPATIIDALVDYDNSDVARQGVRITLNEFFREFSGRYQHLLSNGKADCSGQDYSLVKFNFTYFNLSYSLFNKSSLTHADFSHSYVFQTNFTHSKMGHCRITSNQLATAEYQAIARQKCRKITKREAQAGVMKGLHVYLTFQYKAEVEAGKIQIPLDPLHFFVSNASWVEEKILKHPRFQNEEISRIKTRVSRQLSFFTYLREIAALQPILDETVFQHTDKKRSF